MDGRQELAARINAWLHAKGKDWSPRRLSIAAGLAENVVGRILERPERETRQDTWQKLARYLNWNEAEVLALAGYASQPETAPGGNGMRMLEATMDAFGLDDEEAREHFRRQVRLILRLLGRPIPEP